MIDLNSIVIINIVSLLLFFFNINYFKVIKCIYESKRFTLWNIKF